MDRLEHFVKLIWNLGIEGETCYDFLSEGKDKQEFLQYSMGYFKEMLIKHKLLPISIMHHQGYPLFALKPDLPPSALEETDRMEKLQSAVIKKMSNFYFNSFYIFRHIKRIVIVDPGLLESIQDQNIHHFFIFEDDYRQLTQDKKVNLVQLDLSLAVDFYIQEEIKSN